MANIKSDEVSESMESSDLCNCVAVDEKHA